MQACIDFDPTLVCRTEDHLHPVRLRDGPPLADGTASGRNAPERSPSVVAASPHSDRQPGVPLAHEARPRTSRPREQRCSVHQRSRRQRLAGGASGKGRHATQKDLMRAASEEAPEKLIKPRLRSPGGEASSECAPPSRIHRTTAS
jgi:hypothetical protein